MKKATLYVLLLLLVALICGTAASYDNIVNTDVTAHRGYLKLEKGKPYLQEGKDKQLLLLAPSEALDSLGIVLADGDSLYIEAASTPSGLLVTKIQKEGEFYALRSDNLSCNYYDELSTVSVNRQSCIGCKLCVPQCPVSAISMVKGKAVIDQDKCVSCGICIDGNGKFKGCPVRAISK